jgi:exopolysaccharide biosynthesis polyprenyl glycosylphosphotransferase
VSSETVRTVVPTSTDEAAEQPSLLREDAVMVQDLLVRAVDARTRAILARRRTTAVVRRRGWLLRRMLVLADLIGLTCAFAVAEAAFPAEVLNDHIRLRTEIVFFVLTLPAWVIFAKVHGLYDRDGDTTDHTTADDVVGVLHLVTLGTWLFFTLGWATGLAAPKVPKLLTLWFLAIVLVTLARVVARAYARRTITFLQNTVIVGAGRVGQLIARKYLNHPEYGINVVGFVDSNPMEIAEEVRHIPVLGGPEILPTLVRLLDVERVVIAFSGDSHEQNLVVMRSLKDLDVQFDIVPRFFEIFGANVRMHTVEGLPLVGLPRVRLGRSSRLLKRSVDLVLAAAAFVVLAPVFMAIALAIKLDSRGPVFFRQVRMGSRDRTFKIFKFRTMHADADERKAQFVHLNMHERGDSRMFKVPDDPRVTRVGRILRRWSLDELPQLFNVLSGEMSLVGPRPLILDEDQHVVEWARKRLDIKPGITGLWQVLGASDIPFEEMTRLDYVYVTSWSLWGDIRLMLRTVPALLRTRQAY